MIDVSLDDMIGDLALVAASSASGSYPSFSILSASAFAAFSAASKSISSPTTFFAPSFVPLFAPRMFVRFAPPTAGPLRIAFVDVVLIAVGAGRAASASAAAEDRGDGDLGLAAPFVFPADKKGEAVLEPTGGVPVRDGGLLGRLIVGLSQEEKKSSAGSPAGVEVPSAGVPTISSVITTSSG